MVRELPRKLASARTLYFLALTLALLPLVVSAIHVLSEPSGALVRDQALMELRVRDVGHHPVLIGLYSRYGWSHPGPLLSYMLAVPYRLAGGRASGMLAGALVINAVAIAGMATVARRLGGVAPALLALLGAGVVARALGTQLLFDPWVCYVTVLPFGLFCFLIWAMVEGEAWAVPTAVALASWLAQAHVGYAPLTALPLAGGGVWFLVSVHRAADPDRSKRARRAVALAAVLLVVLWIPTVWDQLFDTGNLGTLVNWFRQHGSGAHTLTDGARIVFGQLAAAPDWVTGTRRVAFNGETTLLHMTLWPVLALPFVLAVAVAVAWRERERAIVRLAAVTVFVLAVAVLSVARTIGIMYEYRLLWTWPVGMLVALVVGWTLWSVVARRWIRSESLVLVPIAVLAIAVLSAVSVVDAVESASPHIYSRPTAQVVDQLAARLGRGHGSIVLRSISPDGEGYLQGLMLGLEHQGLDPRVEADPTDLFGPHRVVDGHRVEARLLVLTGDDLDAFVPAAGQELVAFSGSRSKRADAAARRRVRVEKQRIRARFDAGKLSSDQYLRDLEAVKGPGVAIAVYRDRPTG